MKQLVLVVLLVACGGKDSAELASKDLAEKAALEAKAAKERAEEAKRPPPPKAPPAAPSAYKQWAAKVAASAAAQLKGICECADAACVSGWSAKLAAEITPPPPLAPGDTDSAPTAKDPLAERRLSTASTLMTACSVQANHPSTEHAAIKTAALQGYDACACTTVACAHAAVDKWGAEIATKFAGLKGTKELDDAARSATTNTSACIDLLGKAP